MPAQLTDLAIEFLMNMSNGATRKKAMTPEQRAADEAMRAKFRSAYPAGWKPNSGPELGQYISDAEAIMQGRNQGPQPIPNDPKHRLFPEEGAHAPLAYLGYKNNVEDIRNLVDPQPKRPKPMPGRRPAQVRAAGGDPLAEMKKMTASAGKTAKPTVPLNPDIVSKTTVASDDD